MKMRKLSFLLLCVTFSVFLVGCGGDEPDGIWAKMQWDVPSGLSQVDGVYMIPSSGGTYKFTCKNYKPWIELVLEYNMLPAPIADFHFCEGEWYSVTCDNYDVIITFQRLGNDDEESRDLKVELTAGDIFDYFTFRQTR